MERLRKNDSLIDMNQVDLTLNSSFKKPISLSSQKYFPINQEYFNNSMN